jgi:hypothetical protein
LLRIYGKKTNPKKLKNKKFLATRAALTSK